MFDGWMWGMHFGWWIFWIVIIVLIVVAFGRQERTRKESPSEILRRRYASGEISTEDYEERLAKLNEVQTQNTTDQTKA